MLKFFRIPFGTTGDKTAVPDAVDVNGNVSYAQGYGFDYQRQKTDPAAKNIERDKTNQILFDITNAIAELQSQGVPDFITPALNGGTAYSYAANAVVMYGGELYISLVGANTELPTNPANWASFSSILKGVGVTAPQFDNDTSLATTNFVQRALGNDQGQLITSGAASIAAADVGKTIIAGGAGTYTLTLPALTGVPLGGVLDITATADAITISRAGTDTLYDGTAGGAVISLVLNTGDSVTLKKLGATQWLVAGGLRQAATSTLFGKSLATNGYQKLPSGLIIQWGNNTSSASADVAATFPIAFPTAIRSITITPASSGSGSFANHNGATTTGFNLAAWSAVATRVSAPCLWIAIGH